MKIIDSKGKLFGIINIIDLIVVALILVVGAGAAYKYVQSSENESEGKSIDCTFTSTVLVKEILNDFVKYYNVGDKVYDGANNEIGTITSIDISEAMREVATQDGTIVNSVVPLRSQLNITIEGESVFEELKGLKLGTEYKLAGATLILKNSYFSIGSFVMGFDVTEK